jgi:hypothetical protein
MATILSALAIGAALGAGLVLLIALRTLRSRMDAATTRLDAGLERLERLADLLDERLIVARWNRSDPPPQPPAMEPKQPEPKRRRRPDPAEVRRLAQRGRHSVEIAQLLDADVGEVELILRLDAARAESVSVQRPEPTGPRS